MPVTVYVGVGSNMGNRLYFLRQSLKLLIQCPQVFLINVSRIYETNPAGGPPQGMYLNAAFSIKTSLAPVLLLNRLKAVEKSLGRKRVVRWGPRTVDLDLLLYGNITMSTPQLILPHPRIPVRGFVLLPLSDLAPELIIPGTGRSVDQHCRDIKANEPLFPAALIG